MSGQDWPWGDPHSYPHAPHPICGAAERAWAAARAHGVEMRVGPVAITNGVFGNRPHRIYRGFCLQGCKANAKASPLVTDVPDAIEHGIEIRADSMAVRIEVDESGRQVTGVSYVEVGTGRERFQRAAAVAICGYSIESPRLLLNSSSSRFPQGLANAHDQVGRYVMVQGATQVAGRFPELLRMYKAPPPEVSSEQFYETDESRGFARGFSIQTVARSRSAGPSTSSPTGTAAKRYASTCATTTTGRCSARSASCWRSPTTASRLPTSAISSACRSRVSITASATTTGRTSPTRSRRCARSGRPQTRRTCSRSTATRTSSAAAAWATTQKQASSTPNIVYGVFGITIMALASRLGQRLAAKQIDREPAALTVRN